MAKYVFEENAIFHRQKEADAQIIGEALEQLTARNEGRLKPEHVVTAARSRSHPLHRHFEWNDSHAAAAYRLDQARAIIRSVRLIAEDDVTHATARAWHSITDEGRSYRSITEVQSSAVLQISLHKAALRDLMAWETRYRMIAEVCSLVTVARKRLERKVDELQTPPVVEATPAPSAPRKRGRPRKQPLESRPA